MKTSEFESKKTGEVKSVVNSVETELTTLKEALTKYRVLGTVKEWNELREEATEHFSEETIRALDASGFINEWALKH
jgi:hypothetical protein